MPRQIITIGAPRIASGAFNTRNGLWSYSEPLLIQLNSELVNSGAATEAWLERFVLSSIANQCSLRLWGTPMNVSGVLRRIGELSDNAENFESTFVFRAGGNVIYVPGPNYSGNLIRDDSSEYRWTPPTSTRLEVNTFITGYLDLTTEERNATTLEIRDSYIRLTKGSTTYNKVYAGNTERKKIYYGNRLVHDVVG